MARKAKDAGRLTPTKDDNEAGCKIDRKDGAISWEFDYNLFKQPVKLGRPATLFCGYFIVARISPQCKSFLFKRRV